MRTLMEEYNMVSKTAKGRLTESMKFLLLYVKKDDSSPEEWLTEAEAMSSRSRAGKLHYTGG
jgi:hypothetical protein